MRSMTPLLVATVLAVLTSLSLRTTADESKEKSIDRIVSTLVLKPGEAKELILSSSCMRITRGRGLLLREMGGSGYQAKEWSKDGVSASFHDVKGTDEPVSVKKAGLKLFAVRISASKDAKARLVELHVTDNTCAGNCDADLRVVVIAP
jgi:hypothetical protein